MHHRRLIGLLCLLLTLIPVLADELGGGRGLGGTGLTARDDGSGIGGTGHKPSGDGRGIGGTGIVGTVTAFGSIWVNGVEVHYRDDQPVTLYGRAGTPGDLRVGQVVEVEADESSAGLKARAIGVRHAVAGPVASIDPVGGEMTVLGQRVRLPAGDPLTDVLRPGERVAVSGLRDQDGVVVASRLDRPAADVPDLVGGIIERVEGRDVFIGGRRFRLPEDLDRPGIRPESVVTLYGQAAGDRLSVRRIRVVPRLPFGGKVRNLLVEGFAAAKGLRVGVLSLPGGVRDLKVGERVVVEARVGADSELVPESVRVLPAPRGAGRSELGPNEAGPMRGPLETGVGGFDDAGTSRGLNPSSTGGASTVDRPLGSQSPESQSSAGAPQDRAPSSGRAGGTSPAQGRWDSSRGRIPSAAPRGFGGGRTRSGASRGGGGGRGGGR